MKTTKLFVAALALLSVISCQEDELQIEKNIGKEQGTLITCTFANDDSFVRTTTTDGTTPLWAAGDEVKIYDAASSANTKTITLIASGTPTADQGLIASGNRSFTFTKPDGWSSDICAVYPASAFVAFNGNDAKINFAGQDGTFAKANICAAKTSTTTMSFKNIGAILKFPSKPAEVTDILIPVAGLAKDYTVSFSGTAPSLTPVNGTNSKSYSIGDGTGVIYIGVPAENLAAGNSFIYQDSNKDILGSYTIKANNIETNKIYTLPAIAANGTIPEGILSKKAFSVSATEKVYFSKGNLQATCTTAGAEGTSTYSWAFAEHQYDYVGNAAGNTTISNQELDKKVDLFGWVGVSSTVLTGEATKYGISTSKTNSDYGNNTVDALKADWGNIAISNGGNAANLWSTLSGGSGGNWEYLISTRTVNGGTGEGHSCQRTTLTLSDDSKKFGLIIVPDGYTGTPALSATTSWSDWQTMETAGCVFLPTAGTRNSSSMPSVTTAGNYWSSTPDGTDKTKACNFFFNDGTYFSPANSNGRRFGCFVRLVYAAQ